MLWLSGYHDTSCPDSGGSGFNSLKYKQKDWKCNHQRGQRRSNCVEQGTRGHEIKENQNKYQINIITIIGIIIIIIIVIIIIQMAEKK
jgi:hypothetical protein